MTADIADWSVLATELDHWAAEGRTAAFWWRDDDAADQTPALEQLLDLQAGANVPLALAVIPARATPGLAARLKPGTEIVALQHGYAHQNHAPSGAKKTEFGRDRAGKAVLSDIVAGKTRMQELFGPLFQPVFVPPWNRLDAVHLECLAAAGFVAVSGFQPRQNYWASTGLAALNTHFDPVPWRGGTDLSGVRTAVTRTVLLLADMRLGAAPLQPIGLLTHHLQQPPVAWRAVEQLLTLVSEHPAGRWVGVIEALAVGRPAGVTAAS